MWPFLSITKPEPVPSSVELTAGPARHRDVDDRRVHAQIEIFQQRFFRGSAELPAEGGSGVGTRSRGESDWAWTERASPVGTRNDSALHASVANRQASTITNSLNTFHSITLDT